MDYIEHDYDYKNESPTDKVRNEKRPIKKFFEFKLDYPKTGFDCDRCPLTKEMYKKLWNLNDEGLKTFDFDTMNSFYRIYRLLLLSYDRDYWNKAKITDYPTRYKWLLKDEVYEHYKEINENKTVQRFAELTHSIGNFTLVPKGFNTNRNTLFDDYWDLTLQYFKELYSEDHFAALVKKYFYEDYLNGKDVNVYWEGHTFVNKSLPTHFTYEKIVVIIEKINNLIESRGKTMMNRLKVNK